MARISLSPPVAEVLTLQEAKEFLRVDHDDEDDVIAALIGAARATVEAQTRTALLPQDWRIVCDAWPRDGRLTVFPAPVRQVIAVRVYDAAGVAHEADPSGFVVDRAGSRLGFTPWGLMAPERATAGIEIDVRCGLADTAAELPHTLRHAVRLLVAHWYDNRGLAAIGQPLPLMPPAVHALIGAHRVVLL